MVFKFGWVDKYLKQLPTVIFDVGSGPGKECCEFKKRYPGADVFAFEPCREKPIYQKFEGNCKCFGVKRFTCTISNYNGETLWYQSFKRNKQSSSIFPPTELMTTRHPTMRFRNPYKTQVRNLKSIFDEYNINHVDILHMDVHGAEPLVMEGLGDIIKPKMVFAEVIAFDTYDGPIKSERGFNNFMENLGYKLEQRVPGNNLYIFEEV